MAIAERKGRPGKPLGLPSAWALCLLTACGTTVMDPGLRFCALEQTISCHGNPATPQPFCDDSCAIMPGSSSYDEKTDCATEYGPAQGFGSSCDAAFTDLALAELEVDQAVRCAPKEEDPPCQACVKQSCCSSYDACVENADCMALFYCLGFCADDACKAECYGAQSSGTTLLDSYFACIDTSCAEACAE